MTLEIRSNLKYLLFGCKSHSQHFTAGAHSFRIEVPDAVFANNEGYFFVSLYLQGKTSGTILDIEDATIYPNPSNDIFNIETEEKIEQVTILNLLGQKYFREKKGTLFQKLCK